MKKQYKKGNNLLTFTKGERISILILMMIIAVMLTLSVFPPKLRKEKAHVVSTALLDSLIVLQTTTERHQKTEEIVTSKSIAQTMHPKSQSIETERKVVREPTEAKRSRMLDLNAADSTELIELPQIGEVMASRIQRYRERLGGFVTYEQLYEIKGMDTARFETILPYLTLKEDDIDKLEINRATFKELLRHPYLEYEQVKAIVQHRERRGLFKSWEQVKAEIKDANPLLERYLEY